VQTLTIIICKCLGTIYLKFSRKRCSLGGQVDKGLSQTRSDCHQVCHQHKHCTLSHVIEIVLFLTTSRTSASVHACVLLDNFKLQVQLLHVEGRRRFRTT
jgi:hypothetical protein